MICSDTIIKYVRRNPKWKKGKWHIEARRLLERLRIVKLGFPGIRSEHLSLVKREKIKVGDIFIVDLEFLTGKPSPTYCPKMYRFLGSDNYEIFGIGSGLDTSDPDRQKYKYRDIITTAEIPPVSWVFRVDVRPSIEGGPGYYYFFKSYRDFRA